MADSPVEPPLPIALVVVSNKQIESMHNIVKIVIVFCFFQTAIIAQADNIILSQLFDSSDVVVQGNISRILCIGYSVGVEECGYTLDIDSIYKGNPKTVSDYMLELSSSKNKSLIAFHRQCFWFENCFEIGQSVIVFLKEKAVINDVHNEVSNSEYKLFDRWLGIQEASSILGMELKSISRLRRSKR
ncbi:MAG: hypothetical protein WBP41_22260 [Saprospiraceae bacterium]